MIHVRANDGHAHIKFFIIIIRQRRERVSEKRIEEKVGLVALHACSLTVRPKEELKGVVCTLFRFVSFALVSFYIERYECFLFSLSLSFFLLPLRLLLVICIDLSIFFSYFLIFNIRRFTSS